MTASREPTSPGKPVSASRITISQLMGVEHANTRGDVHGGWIMKLADQAGALAAMRHAQSRVVTLALDQLRFLDPIRIGDLVTLDAELTHVGRTSMEARVEVIAENPVTGNRTRTNTAYLVYVALDEQGKPCPVPALLAETEIEQRRMLAGEKRRQYRLAQQALEAEEEDR